MGKLFEFMKEKDRNLKDLKGISKDLPTIPNFRIEAGKIVFEKKKIVVNVLTKKDSELYKRPIGKYSATIDDREPINHFKNLKKAYKKGGVEEVKTYIDWAFRQFKLLKENIKPETNPEAEL